MSPFCSAWLCCTVSAVVLGPVRRLCCWLYGCAGGGVCCVWGGISYIISIQYVFTYIYLAACCPPLSCGPESAGWHHEYQRVGGWGGGIPSLHPPAYLPPLSFLPSHLLYYVPIRFWSVPEFFSLDKWFGFVLGLRSRWTSGFGSVFEIRILIQVGEKKYFYYKHLYDINK